MAIAHGVYFSVLRLFLTLLFFEFCGGTALAWSPDLLAGTWVIDAQASGVYFSSEEEISEQELTEMFSGITCYFNMQDMEVVVAEWGMELGRRKIDHLIEAGPGYILRMDGKEERVSFLPDGKLRLDEASGGTTIFRRP